MKAARAMVLGLLSIAILAKADVVVCHNSVKSAYKQSPKYFAPDGTRGVGIQVWVNGSLSPIKDTSPGCLPIALRYNNPGVLKTRRSGPWPGQIDRDDKGHAVFTTVEAGVAAWGLWMKRRFESQREMSAFSIMSMYAPRTDCVGSIGKPPDCPYGLNPTAEYAARVAKSVGKSIDEPLNLDGTDCREGRETLYALFQEVSTFEIGGNFCGKQAKGEKSLCVTDRDMFDRAMDSVYGPVKSGKCADAPQAHEGE